MNQVNQYIVMKKNNENQWVLLTPTAYRSEEQARQVIDRQIDLVVLNALDNAVRMHSAVRGMNREKFNQLKNDVLNARKGFKIVRLAQGGY